MGDIVSGETCAQYNGNQESCRDTPGCKYLNGACDQCPPRSYCPGDGTQHACPEHYKDSLPGATSDSDCYKATSNPNGGCYEPDGTPNPNCGLFYDGGTFSGGTGIPKCWNANGQYLTDYHTEGQANLCYANTRNCDQFNYITPGVVKLENGQPDIVGTADWVSNSWNISNCIYNPQLENAYGQAVQPSLHKYIAKNCYTQTLQLASTAQTVQLATSTITYDKQFGNNANQYYYCESCIDGYYVNTTGNNKDYQICTAQDECTFNDCIDDTQGFYVCRCSPVPKGYWLGSSNCSWTSASLSSLNCQPNACPSGKTTEYTATSEPGDCFYTDQTKFCDSKGCFTLPDIGSWDEI